MPLTSAEWEMRDALSLGRKMRTEPSLALKAFMPSNTLWPSVERMQVNSVLYVGFTGAASSRYTQFRDTLATSRVMFEPVLSSKEVCQQADVVHSKKRIM